MMANAEEGRCEIIEPSRPPWRKILTISLGVFMTVQVLNFSGFCYSRLTFLSDADFESIALAYNVRMQQSYIGSKSVASDHLVLYASGSELKQANPNCCRLYRWGHSILGESVGFSRLFGERFYNAVAEVWFRRWAGETEDFYQSYVVMGACGNIVRTAGIPEKMPRLQK
jgi:hypothetical protein